MIFLFSLYLFLTPLFFFIIALIFLPYGFTFYSLFTLISVPKQIWRIAKSQNIRRNHAIEHATINVLEQSAGYQLNISGLSQENGFYITGIDNPDIVEEAAIKGLNLLKQGHCHLAIHRRCGTDLAIANFMTALIFLILLFSSGMFRILNILVALLASNLISPYVGEYVQKYFTTSCEVKNMDIDGLQFEIGRLEESLLLNHFSRGFFVKTKNYR